MIKKHDLFDGDKRTYKYENIMLAKNASIEDIELDYYTYTFPDEILAESINKT